MFNDMNDVLHCFCKRGSGVFKYVHQISTKRLINQHVFQTIPAMPLKGPSQLPRVVLGTKVRVHRSREWSAWPQPKGNG